MTRIRDLLISFRTRRARRFANCDIVSFEPFHNEGLPDFPKTKESSLTIGCKKSPTFNKEREYVQFSPQHVRSNCSRPNLATILLLIVLMAVFLILPIIYLLHCFGIIYTSRIELQHSHFALEKKDYFPNLKNPWKPRDTLKYIDKKYSENNVLPPPPIPSPADCKIIDDIDKFDCYPDDGATEENCNLRGCCWKPTQSRRIDNLNGTVPLDTPYCFYPANFPTYKYVNVSETAFGLIIFLNRSYRSPYPSDAEVLKMTVKYETETRLHIKITNPTQNRYESPYPEVPIVDKADKNLAYKFIMDDTKPGFMVLRKSDNTTVFDSSNLRNMIFAEQFLQISSKLSSKYIYGLGEHRSNLLLNTNWQQFTMFNRDGIPTENENLYGSHPFYLVMEESGNSHGVFLLNSNAMDIILQPTPAITFRTIGGILDFYFLLGPTPANVVSQYTDLLGKPFLPPYWSLGFHLCRFGYTSLNDTREVMQRNIDAGILIDTQWNDLDYMNNSNDFTYDHIKFRELPSFVKELHDRGMHYIPLIDAGISASEVPGSYPPYDKAIEMDILVKNSTGQPFIGKVWNRVNTVWPDFTHPRTVDYWTLMLRSLHDSFEFDGAWIDMNEPSNFLSGSFTGCPSSSLETPPYLPKVFGGQLCYKTFCMTAQHYAGVHYNVHNIYGLTEAIVTSFAMAEIRGKRPVVISRSTFSGHGRYAGHWSGDVVSQWHDMRFSIPQLLSFSLFGIPLMGADICGFNGNTTVPLCNRWSQLGAFYPFSRNHNTDNGIPQDPVAMGQPVIDSAKKALEIRYTLLPYLYTLFWAANVRGDTVARPMFFEFPNDRLTYDIDYMFLWGSSVLIAPVLEENKLSVEIYLPSGIWYDYYSKTAISSKGENVTLPAPIDVIPILLRGGSIIPQQQPNRTTVYSRKSKLELLCVPDEKGQATGQLYWDDGDSLNCVNEKKYSLLQFDLIPNKLQAKPLWWQPEHPPNLGVITILGIDAPVKEVMLNNVSQTFKYDTIHKYLIIEKLNVSFSDAVTLTWK